MLGLHFSGGHKRAHQINSRGPKKKKTVIVAFTFKCSLSLSSLSCCISYRWFSREDTLPHPSSTCMSFFFCQVYPACISSDRLPPQWKVKRELCRSRMAVVSELKCHHGHRTEVTSGERYWGSTHARSPPPRPDCLFKLFWSSCFNHTWSSHIIARNHLDCVSP